jgi:hypothetical protein
MNRGPKIRSFRPYIDIKINSALTRLKSWEKNPQEKTQIKHTETGFSLSDFHSRMLKDYFVDGLVQIAIVLSLLRTDLNNYININYVNYPEVQEIILGSSAAYTQTNFINNNFNSFKCGDLSGRMRPLP